MWRRLLKALVPEDAATTPLLLQAASVHDRVVPVLLQVGLLCRCEASSTLAVYRRVFTPYRRVFTASVYPCHRGRSPLLHYLMALALLPRLNRSSPSPSVRVRDDCLVGCSV